MANATVTVTYGGQSKTFELSGGELSAVEQQSGRVHRYLTNASKDFIDTEVEKALLELVPEKDSL